MPELLTERLRLRPLSDDDFDAFFRTLVQDPEVMRHYPRYRRLADEARRRAAAEADFFDRFDAGWRRAGLIAWALWPHEPPAGRLAGWCGLVLPERSSDMAACRPALEVMLGCAHQGLGLATEATRAVLDDAWRRLRLPCVQAVVGPTNGAARRLLQRCGFRPVVQACGQPSGMHYECRLPADGGGSTQP